MICKIASIKHSGEDGKRRTPRREEEFTSLLGRYVMFDMASVSVGEELSLELLHSSHHKEVAQYNSGDKVVSRKYIRTNNRKSGTQESPNKKDVFEVETERAIYVLEVVQGGDAG